MRRSILIVLALGLAACAQPKPQSSSQDIIARNSGAPVSELAQVGAAPARMADVAAAIQGMNTPMAAAKRAYGVEKGIRASLDSGLVYPVRAVMYPREKLIVMKDLGSEYSAAPRRRGLYRRLIEEELQHAIDFGILLEEMPDLAGDAPEAMIAKLFLEANARAAMLASVAEHAASESSAEFDVESSICTAARQNGPALTGDDPARRREVAEDTAARFLRNNGAIYAAHNRSRYGSEKVSGALKNEAMVRSVYAKVGRMFTLADDDTSYFSADAAVAGLAASTGGANSVLADAELALAKLVASPRKLWPCDF